MLHCFAQMLLLWVDNVAKKLFETKCYIQHQHDSTNATLTTAYLISPYIFIYGDIRVLVNFPTESLSIPYQQHVVKAIQVSHGLYPQRVLHSAQL